MHRKRIVVILSVLGVFCIGWVLVGQYRSNVDNRHQSEQIDAQQQLIDGLAEQLDEAAAQGADVDTPEQVAETVDGAEVSAVGPQGERGPIGETGAAGPAGVGPTDAQIEAAVTVYCSTRNQCREPISQADIVAAVTAYCFPDGCRGFEGALGAQGPPGEQGRPPTAAEIEAAVYAYLAANPPVAGSPGPQGETGERGPVGATGPAGETGVQGPAGEVGPAGPAGPAGVDGAPGTQGPAGVDGRTPSAMTCTETAPLSGVFDCTVTAYQ